MTSRETALTRYYPHLVLAASLVIILVTSGAMYMLVVGLKIIGQDIGWSRGMDQAAPSMAYACLFIGAGLGGIVVGHWMDRNGMGWPALVASVMVGSGALLVAHVTQASDLAAHRQIALILQVAIERLE